MNIIKNNIKETIENIFVLKKDGVYVLKSDNNRVISSIIIYNKHIKFMSTTNPIMSAFLDSNINDFMKDPLYLSLIDVNKYDTVVTSVGKFNSVADLYRFANKYDTKYDSTTKQFYVKYEQYCREIFN